MLHTMRARALAALLTLAPFGLSHAQTVTVTTTADTVDIDPYNGTIAALPGPDGLVSFSEAMIATNNTPGHQTVGFAIPESELGWGFLYPGQAVFHALTGYYWRANDAVTIDGRTQTAFAGDTYADGNEVLFYGKTVYLNAGNSSLFGIDGSSFQIGGVGNLVDGTTGAMNLTLFGGGGSTLRDNLCGTIKLDRTDGNLLVGNTTQRVRVLGGGAAQPASDNVIGGPNPADRNFITGYGTWNSEGLPAGAAIQLAWTNGTLVEGNWIGTTPDGLSVGNLACTMGISFEGDNTDVTVRNNRIAGIRGQGTGPHYPGALFGRAIYFWGNTSNVQLLGNTIGLDALGAPSLGSVRGVDVDNYAGYSAAGVSLVGNEIAGHVLDGVRVAPTGRLLLSANRIHTNGALGIDLIPDDFSSGVSPNDPLDADSGGNEVQNYPELDLAANEAGLLHLRGRLASSPAEAFTLEFFSSAACDPSGNGPAEAFLGTAAVVTDGAGNAAFDVLLPLTLPAGDVVTATATRDAGAVTSELSACLPVVDATCQRDLGFGGPGASVLRMCGGDLSTGTTATLVLSGVPPAARVFLGLGPSFNPTAVLGGTLVPFPASKLFAYTADASGRLVLPAIPGGNGPRTLYVQCVYPDAAHPAGWGISNALQVELLP